MSNRTEILYNLIKSLDRNEKSYFVKYASALPGKPGKRYMQLFNTLHGMKVYDDAVLQKKLEKQGFPEHSHRVRLYLYELILSSLEQYYSEHSATDKSLVYLRRAYLLWERRLYEQSNLQLDKAEKQTAMFGSHNLRCEVLRLQLRNGTAMHQAVKGNTVETIDRMVEMAEANLQWSRAYKAYAVIYDRYLKHGPAKTDEEIEQYGSIYRELIADLDVSKMDEWGKLSIFQVESYFGIAVNNYPQAIQALEKANAILKENLNILENKKFFSGITGNLLLMYLAEKEFEKAESELNDLERWFKKHRDQLSKENHDHFLSTIHMQRFNLIVADHSRIGDDTTINRTLAYLQSAKLIPRDAFLFKFNLVVLDVYRNRLKPALKNVNTLLNEAELKEQDVAMNVELLLINLCIHAKLEHLDHVEHEVSKLKRRQARNPEPIYQQLLDLLITAFGQYTILGPSKRATWKADLVVELKSYISNSSSEAASLEFDYVWYFEEVF